MVHYECVRESIQSKIASAYIHKTYIVKSYLRWSLKRSTMSYDYLERACIGHGSCVQTSHNGIKKEESVCILTLVPNPFSWRFVHLGLELDWGIQNESCRSKNIGKKLCWMIKNDSEKRLFFKFANQFLHSFHINWHCS